MSKITVINRIDTYPDNTNDSKETITIKNHWNEKSKVVLVVNNLEYVVLADDLEKAICNATNAH